MIDLFPNVTFFYQLAIFLLVILVLSKGLFNPLIAVLDERKRRSVGTLQEAAALEAELEQKIARCEQTMLDARTRALAEREIIRNKGAVEAKKIVAAAREASETELNVLRKSLQAEAAGAKASLESMVAELSQHVVKKVLASAIVMLAVIAGLVYAPSELLAGSAEHGAGHAEGIPNTVWFHFVNFFILAGILGYILRKPLRDFFADRRGGIERVVNAAQVKRVELEARAREVNARLSRLEADAKALQTSIVSGAESERRMLVEEAEKLAQKIKSDVALMTEQELRKAKEELKTYALTLTFERAEANLRGSFNDDKAEETFDRGRLGELRGSL